MKRSNQKSKNQDSAHMMASSDKIYINTVSAYIKKIEIIKETNELTENNAELLFRGQGIEKPLIPKIGRLTLRIKTNRL